MSATSSDPDAARLRAVPTAKEDLAAPSGEVEVSMTLSHPAALAAAARLGASPLVPVVVRFHGDAAAVDKVTTALGAAGLLTPLHP